METRRIRLLSLTRIDVADIDYRFHQEKSFPLTLIFSEKLGYFYTEYFQTRNISFDDDGFIVDNEEIKSLVAFCKNKLFKEDDFSNDFQVVSALLEKANNGPFLVVDLENNKLEVLRVFSSIEEFLQDSLDRLAQEIYQRREKIKNAEAENYDW